MWKFSIDMAEGNGALLRRLLRSAERFRALGRKAGGQGHGVDIAMPGEYNLGQLCRKHYGAQAYSVVRSHERRAGARHRAPESLPETYSFGL